MLFLFSRCLKFVTVTSYILLQTYITFVSVQKTDVATLFSPLQHDVLDTGHRLTRVEFSGAVNESTVGVGGDSAGGRIAALVCHELSGIKYQVNVCPKMSCDCALNAKLSSIT